MSEHQPQLILIQFYLFHACNSIQFVNAVAEVELQMVKR